MKKLICQDQPHPSVADSLNNLGNVYDAKGQYKLPLDYSNQALKIISVFPNYPYQNTIQNFMAEVEDNLSTTTPSTNDNIDTDVHLLGDDSSATNQDLPPSP